ncbi:hypothetical protein PENSPDRAFT_657649 [Peniophora sp. CONT]|nr:hypothetical protein PENSPDRAFT_657649 [Peniophora sp. CONT]
MAEATSVNATTAVKRRRVDGVQEPMQPADAPSEKYRSLWLEDGNIVLQCAEGAFRVHRSLLVAQSEVFRDTFDLATPTADANLGNPVPVVHLSDDTDQMYTFLRSLMFHDDPVQNVVLYTDQILDIIRERPPC